MQDYVAHELKAMQTMRKIHSLTLKRKYQEAIDEVDEVIVELRMMKAAMTDLKERHERTS
jgi:CRISPR/Cas system CSM-associated protein Csm2 small subunit